MSASPAGIPAAIRDLNNAICFFRQSTQEVADVIVFTASPPRPLIASYRTTADHHRQLWKHLRRKWDQRFEFAFLQR
jgi:hypothetical protein